MPVNVCCVPGCPEVAGDGVHLHCFPCPEKDAERFREWVKVIGGDIASLDSNTVRRSRRICRRHFQKQFIYPRKGLCKLAVPSLHLPSADVSAPKQMDPDCQPSTSTETTPLNPNVIEDSTRTVEHITYSSEKALLRKKWKNIGDRFMKEYKKISVLRSGDTGTDESDHITSSRPYFQMMRFLKDDVTPEVNEGYLEDTSDENYYIERSPTPQSIAGTSTSTQYSRKRKSTQDIRQEIMELEQKKLNLLKFKLSQSSGSQEQDCEDLLFFKSLLPYVKELSPMQKLRTRNKITQIIMDEMNSTG